MYGCQDLEFGEIMSTYPSDKIENRRPIFQSNLGDKMAEWFNMDSVRLPTMQDVSSAASTISDTISEMKDSVSNNLNKMFASRRNFLPNYFKSDRQKHREKTRELLDQLYTSKEDSTARIPETQKTKIQQEREYEAKPTVNETSDVVESFYGNSVQGDTVTDWIAQLPQDTSYRNLPKSASAFAKLDQTSSKTVDHCVMKKRTTSNIEQQVVKTMLEMSDLDDQCLNRDSGDRGGIDDAIAALKDLRNFDVSTLLEDLSKEKRREEHLREWSAGTVNTIPEPEQQFKRSPHVKKRLFTKSKIDSQVEQYVGLKVGANNERNARADKSTKVGTINIKIQFLIVTERLKITIKNINDIKEGIKLKKGSFVEVTVLPKGKQPCKKTRVSRGTREVDFSQDVFINNVTLEDVHTQSLHFGWFKYESIFSKKKCLGETCVCLDDKDVVGCASVSEDLNLYN